MNAPISRKTACSYLHKGNVEHERDAHNADLLPDKEAQLASTHDGGSKDMGPGMKLPEIGESHTACLH